MVKLAMYKGKGTLANAGIRLWTGSQYSHCELVANGWCYSSSVMDRGVRRKLIDLDSGNWDVIDLPWVGEENVLSYFKETDSYRYGWWGLIVSQFLNLNRKTNRAQFCSEWCANAILLPNSPSYSPPSLYSLIIWIKKNAKTISQGV